MSKVTPGLRRALGTLQAFKVLVWGESSDDMPESASVRVDDLNEAHVISSLLREQPAKPDPTDIFASDPTRHQIVIDVDHPVHVVESSTPGHHHVIIEVPGGIEAADYWNLLGAMATAGVVEQGYVNASMSRGRTDVRLPWVTKADTPPTPAQLPPTPVDESNPHPF